MNHHEVIQTALKKYFIFQEMARLWILGVRTVWLFLNSPSKQKIKLNFKRPEYFKFRAFYKRTQKSHYDVLRNIAGNSLSPLTEILNRFTLQEWKIWKGLNTSDPNSLVGNGFLGNPTPMQWRNHPFNVIGLSISVLPQSFTSLLQEKRSIILPEKLCS